MQNYSYEILKEIHIALMERWNRLDDYHKKYQEGWYKEDLMTAIQATEEYLNLVKPKIDLKGEMKGFSIPEVK